RRGKRPGTARAARSPRAKAPAAGTRAGTNPLGPLSRDATMIRRYWRRATVRPRLESLEDRCVPSAWAAESSGTMDNLLGVWGSGTKDIFDVGYAFNTDMSLILHSSNDGASWQPQAAGTRQALLGVWGSGPNDVFAVGESHNTSTGVILHSSDDGASWTPQ